VAWCCDHLHDSENSSFLLSGFPYTITNLISNSLDPVIAAFHLGSKPLQECTIYAMLSHPMEMPGSKPSNPGGY
jgi:hypothetical protein